MNLIKFTEKFPLKFIDKRKLRSVARADRVVVYERFGTKGYWSTLIGSNFSDGVKVSSASGPKIQLTHTKAPINVYPTGLSYMQFDSSFKRLLKEYKYNWGLRYVIE